MSPLQGGFEQRIEGITQSTKKAVKQQTTATTQAVKSQVVPQKTDVGTAEGGAAGTKQAGSASDQTIEQAAKTMQQQSQKTGSGQKQPSPFHQRQIAKGKTPEEAANLENIRKELHKQYFEQLTNPPKSQAVVLEVQKKQEEMALIEGKKERKKLPPLPVQQKQRRIESLPGSG